MGWTLVCKVEELRPGFHLETIGHRRVCLAVIDGEVFAFDPSCPHLGGPLELAETEGFVIACPLHGWRFDLHQHGRELHGCRGLQMYDLRVSDGQIYIAWPDLETESEPVQDGATP